MYKAWSNNESCEVQIRFWRADPMGTGIETEFFKISLEGAIVAAISMHWPNSLASQTASVTEQVEYAFTYQKITWDFIPGSRSHQDEWYQRSP
jgi:type VI secretion system Hcp family effector